VISGLTRVDWNSWKLGQVSRQKKDALFDLACRLALLCSESRTKGQSTVVSRAADSERRKSLRFGFELLENGSDEESLEQGFEEECRAEGLEGGDLLEYTMVLAGLKSLERGEHPFIALRRMTAFLGTEYFDKAGSWMKDYLKRRKADKPMTFLVPGDFPDVVRTLALDGHSLERVLRAGGRGLASAALAGCPQESVELAKPVFGPLGGAVLEDDAQYLRRHLSGDEISQAQSALLELITNLEEGGELELTEEEELYGEPDFVDELTRAVMSLEERDLKPALKNYDPRLLAMAMQGMQPEAHERILGMLPKKDERRVLNAVDSMILLPRREIEAAARTLAERIIGSLRKTQGGDSPQIPQFARIRDWPTVDQTG